MTTASLLAGARNDVVDEPKERILDEYDALPAGSTERGGPLRREGLSTSHIAEWRKARDAGAREGLARGLLDDGMYLCLISTMYRLLAIAGENRDRRRQVTLNAAYAANPARFRHRPPTPPKLPIVAWINEPSPDTLIQSA